MYKIYIYILIFKNIASSKKKEKLPFQKKQQCFKKCIFQKKMRF